MAGYTYCRRGWEGMPTESAQDPQRQVPTEPRFCPQCGSPVADWIYCVKCGAALPASQAPVAEPPADVQPQTPPVAPPVAARARFRRRWLIVAAVWVALLVVAGTGGLAYGFLRGPGPGPEVPSAEQQVVLDEFGTPPAFVVADGPYGPGEESGRVEQWLYSDSGQRIVFVNGSKASDDDFTPEVEFSKHACAPTDFDRSMRIRDVEALLGEKGVRVPGVKTAFDGYEAFDYKKGRVIVGYLDGWFCSVQTY